MSPATEIVTVTVKFPRELLIKVDEIAAAELLSRSDILRRFVLVGLKKKEVA